jgi:hypothetical protein
VGGWVWSRVSGWVDVEQGQGAGSWEGWRREGEGSACCGGWVGDGGVCLCMYATAPLFPHPDRDTRTHTDTQIPAHSKRVSLTASPVLPGHVTPT